MSEDLVYTDRELMQMALDALSQYINVVTSDNNPERWAVLVDGGGAARKAMKALSDRLAQPEPKPVGYMYVNKDGECEEFEYGPVPFFDPDITPVYAEPPKREWVGLTEEEFFELLHFDGRFDKIETPLLANFIRAIQSKLKEKNT